jgi:hypothetical protein
MSEHFYDPNERFMSPDQRRWVVKVTIACIVVGGVVSALTGGSDFEPDARVQGTLTDGTQLDSLVDITCADGEVNGKVHVVTQRQNGEAARGRELEIHYGTTDAGCDETIAGYLASPEVVARPIVESVNAASPGGSSDGTPEIADDYRSDLEGSDALVVSLVE